MRRVWIAEWWDALRQDAHFTWRSWRRQPGVRAGGHPRAGARPRRLDGALRRARPRALQAAAVRGSRSPRLGRADHRPARVRGSDRVDGRHVLRAGVGHAAGAVPVGDGDGCPGRYPDLRDRRGTAGRPAVRPRRAQLPARPGRARRAGPRLRARGRRARGAAGRAHQPRAVGPALRRGSGSRRSDAESRAGVVAPAGPHHRRPAARTSRCRSKPADILLPAQLRPLDPNEPVPHVDHGARTTQAGRDTRAREADAGVRSGRSRRSFRRCRLP